MTTLNGFVQRFSKHFLVVLFSGLLASSALADTVGAPVTAGTNPNAVAVNSTTNKIYVANFGSGNVTVIDGITSAVTTVATGLNPFAIAVNPLSNRIYVANLGGNSVTVINGVDNTTTTVTVGTAPYAVAVNTVTNMVYVVNSGAGILPAVAGTVSVIDGVTDAVAAPITVGTYPWAVAVNSVTNRIYVTNHTSNSVSVINGATNGVIATPAVGTNPRAIAVNTNTNKIYVANHGSANATVIDGVSNAPTNIATGSNPSSIAVNSVTNKIYVPNNDLVGVVTVIDGVTNVPTSVPSGSFSNDVAVNAGANSIYVANGTGDTITIINGVDNTTATLTTGTDPWAVAVNTVTNKTYIANYNSGNVTVLSPGTGFALSVSKSGTGLGTVTSAPAAINCGTTCSASFTSGASVTLTAAPTTGSTFSSWSGACSGTGSCVVSMTAARSVTASFTLSAPAPGLLINISTRGQVQTGDNVMIGGFIIGGTSSKTVLIRAVGPNLANFGVPGVLANPTLQLFSGQTVIASNDNWGSAANVAAIQATGLAPVNSLESAILVTLAPGPYTAIVSGVGGGTGIGIVEVFEIDNPASPLINISTRGRVQTGDSVMIGGFIIQGSASRTVLIRAVGPNLANFGVPGVLANPTLQLFSGQTVIASNDDWQSNTNVAAIQATGLAPANSLESALLVTLAPGAYTAIVSGVGGGTGVGIIEVFLQ